MSNSAVKSSQSAQTLIRVLILGTGAMAAQHAQAFQGMDGVELVAGIDQNPKQLNAFCDTYKIAQRFDSVEAALAWGKFDAVSNVTPDAAHYATTLPCLAAGKHVLCEKPLALNYAHAAEMAAAAKSAGVVNMVNLTYRKSPALQKAAEMVVAGQIGKVRHFKASYLQSWLCQPAWGDWATEHQWLWRLSEAHGSKGVLGDIGVHILDYATLIAGSDVASVSCRLKTFDKAPDNQIGPYRLDANDSCMMTIELQNGATGVLHASRFATGHLNDLRLRIHGDKGALTVETTEHGASLQACLSEDLVSTQWHDISLPTRSAPVFTRFIAAIRGQGPQNPDFARGAALQNVLDRAFDSNAAGGRFQTV
ncbi:MAG: Gfo/Idh/MocA family oxidoreductase [Pseudoruegeria sp.]